MRSASGETWCLTLQQLESKLRLAQGERKRKMIGAKLRVRKRASWIREQTRVEDIVQIKKKRSGLGLVA